MNIVSNLINKKVCTTICEDFHYISKVEYYGRSKTLKTSVTIDRTLTKEELKDLKKELGFFSITHPNSKDNRVEFFVQAIGFGINVKKLESILEKVTDVFIRIGCKGRSSAGNMIQEELKLAKAGNDYYFFNATEFRQKERDLEEAAEEMNQISENYFLGTVGLIAYFLVVSVVFLLLSTFLEPLAFIGGVFLLLLIPVVYVKFAKKMSPISIVIHVVVSLLFVLFNYTMLFLTVVWQTLVEMGYQFTLQEFVVAIPDILNGPEYLTLEPVGLVIACIFVVVIVLFISYNHYDSSFKKKVLTWM